MASGMPELGSKISLISKADIRYEGRLFTVDPQECTIALASVRSFGTEDRESQYPVAPQNQVYEYILFRGSDIKDIRVMNSVPSIPNDPAIMQLSVPPSMGNMGGGGFQQSPFGPPVVNPMQYNQYHAMGGMPPSLRPVNINQQSSELSSQPVNEPTNQQPGQAKDQGSMLEMITSGSRSETPLSNLPRKSPTMEQSTQAGSHQGLQKHQQHKNNQQQGALKNIQNRPNQNQMQRESRNDRPQQNNHDQNNKMNARPRSQNRNNINQQQTHHPQQQIQGHQQSLQGHQQSMQGHQQSMQGHQQQQMQQMNRQSWGQNRQRGGGGGRGTRGRGGFTGRPQQGSGDGRPKNTLKFDNDYDFEQANTEFEELRNQLAKTKISDSDSATKPPETETKEAELKPEIVPIKEPELDDDRDSVSGYDKTKSFFDNISCEAVERSKGRSQRTDWKTERKLNSETFGVASARRGGYRGGRGYWNGGSGGNSGGGGMQQGWRGSSWRGQRGNNHRGSSQHRQRQNNQVQPSSQKMVTVTG